MEYKDPKEALKTREENGFRIALNDDTFRFPSEATLKAAIEKLNEMTTNHELKPCPAGQECRLCFLTKASAESKVLEAYGEKTFHALLGPLAHVMVAYETYFAMLFFFYMIGEAANQGNATNSAAEIEALNKMFGLENNSAEGDKKSAN